MRMLPLSLAALVRLYNLLVWLSHLPRSVTLNNSYSLIELAEIGLDCLSVAYLAQIVGDIGQTDLTRLGTTSVNSLLASGIVYVAVSLLAVYPLCRTRSSMQLLHLDLGPRLLASWELSACGKEPLGSNSQWLQNGGRRSVIYIPSTTIKGHRPLIILVFCELRKERNYWVRTCSVHTEWRSGTIPTRNVVIIYIIFDHLD